MNDRNYRMISRRTSPCRVKHLLILALLLLAFSASRAATIEIEWDPPLTGEVAGYKVYYGISSGGYLWILDAGPSTSATLSDLSDCVQYYWAIKAYDSSGQESAEFSNEMSGMPRPRIDAVSPFSAEQGDVVGLSVTGANFSPGISLESSNPHMSVTSTTQLSCYDMVATIEIDPLSRGVQPAPIGSCDFTLINPDMVFGIKEYAFTVMMKMSRLDIDMSGRVDGMDLNILAQHFGTSEGDAGYNPDCDLDGNGRIDGVDLAYLAANFGESY